MNEEMLRVAEFLESIELQYVSLADGSIIRVPFRSDLGAFDIYVQVQKDFMLKVSATPILLVPEGSRIDVAVGVALANMGLNCGFFEINMDSGDLWYRFHIPLQDGFPSNVLLQLAIDAGRILINRYLPAFLSIIYGNEPAKDAVALVENLVASKAE